MEKPGGRPNKRPAKVDSNPGLTKRPNPTLMRSTQLSDVTLVIHPWSNFQKRHDQIPIHGVTFKQVKEAFMEVASRTAANPGVCYDFQFADHNDEHWVKLSTNPFYHYETWIRQKDLSRCGRVDRELPNGDDVSVRNYN
ncbi:hypothetical protein EYZ11_012891 [Aspergillus tanneri]|uniref:Uncharacterized protein n=1 Tax=Aspergillus tanneri TaxID=1220188 RepID=A0A4S3J172_9EURO|nr:hypothetical protein EYZ11_012891 [Aspergillus tanneri]